jgi:hypothetical protein
MAITRTVRHLEIHVDTATQAISRVELGCRCLFDADPDNPHMAAPERGERYGWNYDTLSDDEQAAVVALINAMTARMDTDHPINSGS